MALRATVGRQLTAKNSAAWDKKLPPSRLILFGYVLRVSAGQAIETRFLFQKNEKTTSFWNRNAIIAAGDTNEAY